MLRAARWFGPDGYARRFLTTFAPRFDKVPLIILDHVRKVKPKNERDHERRIAAEVNGVCKDIAAEHDAVWLNLNQRSSSGVKRKNPRPIDADIYGGEMAREDYDGMFYLYRAWKYRSAQLATAADEKEEREIEGRFARERWEEDHAELGALKVRFGDPSVRRRIRFEATFTRYVSTREEAPAELFDESLL
jgi:replicative DNA helicase